MHINKIKIFTFHSNNKINDPVNIKDKKEYFHVMKCIKEDALKWTEFLKTRENP